MCSWASCTLHKNTQLLGCCLVFFYEMVGQMRPQEETEERVTETIFITLLGTGGTKCHTGPLGQTPGWSEGKRQEQRKCPDHGFLGSFCGKGKARQVDSLGLAWLNNFSGAWGVGTCIYTCLVCGPGLVKAEDYSLLGSRGQIEQVWLWIG